MGFFIMIYEIKVGSVTNAQRGAKLLKNAGYPCPAMDDPGRKLIFENPEAGVRYFWVKPSDVAIYVERGAADIGVCGKDILAEYEIHPGDLFFLPAGRVHSIGAGAFIAEIQQTSDITYRIYDFNRKDADGNTRELHTELAKGAIDYTVLPDYRTKYEQVQDRETELVSCPYFTTSLCDLTAPLTLDYAALDSFVVVICVEGKGMIADDSGNEMPIHQGETVLLPATVKSLRVVP